VPDRKQEVRELVAGGATIPDVARAYGKSEDWIREVAAVPLEPHLDPAHTLRLLGLDARTARVLLRAGIETRTQLLAAGLRVAEVEGIGPARLARVRAVIERERNLA